MRCVLFGHTWDFNTVESDSTTYNILLAPVIVKSTIEYRLCTRCYKKQKRIHAIGSYSKSGWKDCKLTLAEVRDKKLKKLGV